MYLQELATNPCEFTQDFRRLLAYETGSEPDQLQPAALRGFFERRVAFGEHRLLQHMGALLGRMWEHAERGRASELQALIAAGAAFVEQTALNDGQMEVSWLLTGLAPPAAQPPAALSPQRPGASLLPPRWLSANLAYLQDLDYLSARLRRVPARAAPAHQQQTAEADPEAATADTLAAPAPRRKRGARGRRGAGARTGAAAPATTAP